MKTVAVLEPGVVEIIDTPIPKPKPYQALVKTNVACICNNTDSELSRQDIFQAWKTHFLCTWT